MQNSKAHYGSFTYITLRQNCYAFSNIIAKAVYETTMDLYCSNNYTKDQDCTLFIQQEA